MRAFVQLREAIADKRELACKIKEPERRVQQKLATHDQAISGMLNAIRELMVPPDPLYQPVGLIREKLHHHRIPLRCIRATCSSGMGHCRRTTVVPAH